MIFRLIHGGVRENLALTPVIHEWKIRGLSKKLFIETSMPEIFGDNPDVDGISDWTLEPEEEFVIDFDTIEEPNFGIHPVELYALAALGDSRLSSRRMMGYENLSSGSVLDLVCVGREFAEKYPSMYERLGTRFEKVDVVDFSKDRIREIRFRISRAKLFIGIDEDATWLAMTTDVPIVMGIGNRRVEACRPSREGVPFEVIGGKCELREICLKGSNYNFGNVFRVVCKKEQRFSCEDFTVEEMTVAMDKALKPTGF